MQQAAKSAIAYSDINPMGTDGFEFVEYATQEPEKLEKDFFRLGFTKIAKHRSKEVYLYRQGGINFIINSEKGSHAEKFYAEHGPSVNAMAFRVKDAKLALQRAKELGVTVHEGKVGAMELHIPAISGIGGSLIYLVDMYGSRSIYDIDFIPLEGVNQHPVGNGLLEIDHLTHNVFRGHMDEWADFYTSIFNFREIRYFDIEGKLTGLKSKAMTSPCGKIRIPINESSDDKSQIEEYLREYKGEGIQHIALSTGDIYSTVEGLKTNGLNFLDTPDTYYEMIDKRVFWHEEDLPRLRRNSILIDGAPPANENASHGDILLQIFTKNMIGPIFFEIIQRKGNEGFGEGNFKALFESIELDQVRRGVI